MWKKAICATLVVLSVAIVFNLYPVRTGVSGQAVQVLHEGARISFESDPVTKNGATYVQARPFIQSFGMQISWNEKKKFRLSKPRQTIDMEVGVRTAYVNGEARTLDVPPLLVGSTLFLSMKAVAEVVDYSVAWNPVSQTANVTKKATAGNGANDGRTTATKPPAQKEAYKIVGYYPSWGTYYKYEVPEVDASKLTHINYAFAKIEDGRIVPGDTWADVEKPFAGGIKGNFGQLVQLKKANPKLRTLISVGGWTWSGGFSDVALTETSRAKFADSAVRFVRDYGFDGVDLDWEYPVGGGLPGNKYRSADKQNFTSLLKAVRNKLDASGEIDGRDYLLTIAAGAFPRYLNNVQIGQVVSAVDWINLMTYDYFGDWSDTGDFHASLFGDSKAPNSLKSNVDGTVRSYLAAGVPSGKLVMGIPFYGRGWTACGSSNGGLGQACGGVSKGTITQGIHEYDQLEKLGWLDGTGGAGFERHWSDSAKAPYLYKPSTGTFIAYDDPRSIGYKADYIKTNRLGGGMIWELSQDDKGTLLNALSGKLNGK